MQEIVHHPSLSLLLFALNEMVDNQSEEDVAQMRRRTGVTQVDSVFLDDQYRPHPGGGGSQGYDIILQKCLLMTLFNIFTIICYQ